MMNKVNKWYSVLKKISGYLLFRQNVISEIKDLNVLLKYRNQCIGLHLLKFEENAAKDLCYYVGIGVGLSKDY